MRFTFSILFSLASFVASAQFAPQAGVPGSTAVPASSPQIVAWASSCAVQRGLRDVAVPDSGFASSGSAVNGVGISDGSIVSLGDSGVAVLTFAQPITNGPGADFAVFENGFPNPQNAEEAFLELAFVEVSSDGINYVRFPATSLTQVAAQIAGSGTYMDARLLNNLAGKYRAGFGVPFDLAELTGTPGIDVNGITHVRIVDVIGSVGDFSSTDSAGRKINDPYPTNFPTGGFDLDAVGVINSSLSISENSVAEMFAMFPNPTNGQLTIGGLKEACVLDVLDVFGRTVLRRDVASPSLTLDLSLFSAGVYQIILHGKNGQRWSQNLLKR